MSIWCACPANEASIFWRFQNSCKDTRMAPRILFCFSSGANSRAGTGNALASLSCIVARVLQCYDCLLSLYTFQRIVTETTHGYYEYIRVTYECIRVTYEYIRVTYGYIRVTYGYIGVTYGYIRTKANL